MANTNAWQRRGTRRTIPELGTVDQRDDGTWSATALDGLEYGPFRFRPEAAEALLLVAIFGPADQCKS